MRRKSLLKSISLDVLKQMFDNGMSKDEIADTIGVSRATIYRYLKGYTHRGGGRVSSRIPKEVIKPKKTEEQEIHEMGQRNAANACLVVVDRSINLKGQYGEYLVEPSKKRVTANICGEMIDLDFDIIPGLIEELKAIGRNIESVAVGTEMW